MNTTTFEMGLKTWELILETGKEMSLEKTSEILLKNPNARINRIDNPPIIFDRKFYIAQKRIQDTLTQQHPEYSDLINSVPPITGYAWKIVDYIDLYFSHFNLVVQKLKESVQEH